MNIKYNVLFLREEVVDSHGHRFDKKWLKNQDKKLLPVTLDFIPEKLVCFANIDYKKNVGLFAKFNADSKLKLKGLYPCAKIEVTADYKYILLEVSLVKGKNIDSGIGPIV